MPPLTNVDRLAAYVDALSNWSFTGFIQFELTEQAHRWIRRELGNVTLKELSRLMCEYVAAGGTVDEVPETRPEWTDQFDFHWDLRFEVAGKRIYVETRLHYRLPLVLDKSWILVVNVHEP